MSTNDDKPTPQDDAFYRVGQTGVERALPVADAPAAKPGGR